LNKIILILSLTISSLFSQDIIITTGEWNPWVGKDLKKNGVAIDIVTKVLKDTGYNPKVSYYSWNRAYKLAARGKVADATAVWFMKDERKKDFYFSDAIFSTQDILVYKKGENIKFDKLSDLKKYKIAITRGYSYGQDIDNMIEYKELKVTTVNSDIEGLNRLIKRKSIDVFLCANSVAKSLINSSFTKEESSKLAIYSKSTITNPLYFLVSKKTKDGQKIIDDFNKSLKKFHANGEINKMLEDSLNGKYK